MKKRIVTTLLLCSAGLISAGAPLAAQDIAAPSANAAVAAPTTPPSAQPDAAPPSAAAVAAPAAPAPAAAPDTAAPVAAATPAASGDAPGSTPLSIDASTTPNENDSDGIAATVNDESISDYELRQRMALFIATSGLNPNAQDLIRIRGQILDKMEDEKIQLQEAVKQHITVSPVEVDKSINQLLTQNHLTVDQLRQILTNAGASELALRSQITAQIAWQKTVQQEYSDRINISPSQIDAEVQRYADGANKPHFLVNEIFLPVTSPDQDAKVLKDAQNISGQIQSGASFQAVAHQFSQNPAAAQGGSIGWVHEGQLSPELDAVLRQMTPGGMSSPVRSAGGYYILNLQARQEPLGTKVADAPTASTNPDGTLALVRLLLPLGSNPSKELISQAMDIGGQLQHNYAGCDHWKTLSAQMKGAVFMDLGNMKPSDLSADIQKALATTAPGESTPPIMSDAGVELIGRCDKRVEVQTAYVMPSREQVEEELFDQQISALANRYLRDLKRDADVEVR